MSFYNIKCMQMEGLEKGEEAFENENNSKHNNTSGEVGKFTRELTAAQANSISKFLPHSYSLVLERQTKSKRNPKKRQTSYKKDQIAHLAELEEPSERTKKVPNYRYNEEIVELNNYSRASSQAYPQQVDDAMKPCLRLIHMLKSHKSSWPFRTPVDPVALNIPNYPSIIKEPMDLQTAEQNLKNRVYLTASQFHADIKKIIRNSNEFNKHNPDFLKYTSDFEKYYLKISADNTVSRSYQTQNTGTSALHETKKKSRLARKPSESRYKQPNESNPVTLVEKKNLAGQIKKLPKEYLAEVAEIVYEGQIPVSQQLDLENLSTTKIRQLQRLVREKMTYLKINQMDRQDAPAADQARSDESSFEDDSDS